MLIAQSRNPVVQIISLTHGYCSFIAACKWYVLRCKTHTQKMHRTRRRQACQTCGAIACVCVQRKFVFTKIQWFVFVLIVIWYYFGIMFVVADQNSKWFSFRVFVQHAVEHWNRRNSCSKNSTICWARICRVSRRTHVGKHTKRSSMEMNYIIKPFFHKRCVKKKDKKKI